jgi:VanZ family protein
VKPLARALLWIPACAHMAFIFAASSVPGSQLPAHLWDKLVHLIVYAALGVFFVLPLSRGRLSGVTWRAVAGATVLSFLYGVSDELHQRFVPERTPDVMDVVADTLGAGVGAVFAWACRLVLERLRSGAK